MSLNGSSSSSASSDAETKQAQMKKQWSSGFSWADDSDSDSDSDDDDYCIPKSSSAGSLRSMGGIGAGATPSSSPASSPLRIKSVRFAPIAEMRLIPSLPDLSDQALGKKEPEMFVERNARTVIL
eukprot:CAMPEP_0197437648 /NCGR_PEP_ID=MMETSP1175-20131217/4844_1 /TAXON_ID=1003142 /ORGANISM="Triceratium dubium, Strain CCMP147" /LENGTH=124 /DNA_ID=CAMNT_0042967225 /DNA_START=260 /DNA_END=634 /DNA_ORIENTATION=+